MQYVWCVIAVLILLNAVPAQAPSAEKRPPVKMEGVVNEKVPDAEFKFRVTLSNGHQVWAHVSGKLKMKAIRVLPGSRVMVEISPYDPARGRIIEMLD